MLDRVAASPDALDPVTARRDAERRGNERRDVGLAERKKRVEVRVMNQWARKTYLELWISSVQLDPIFPFAFTKTKLDDNVSPHATMSTPRKNYWSRCRARMCC
jgi:hypothetical protein